MIKAFFLILISLIKFIESCMKLTNCQWSDPCNNYSLKDCLNHNECTIGSPDDSSVEIRYEHDFGGYNEEIQGNQINQSPTGYPQPLICKDKKIPQCYFKLSCTIF